MNFLDDSLPNEITDDEITEAVASVIEHEVQDQPDIGNMSKFVSINTSYTNSEKKTR